jgi:hypothetical protein
MKMVLSITSWYFQIYISPYGLLLLISNTKISDEMKLYGLDLLYEACPIPISKCKFKKVLDTVTN